MADEKMVNPAEPEEEEDNIIELTDEDGCVVKFEYITTVDYEGEEYLIVMPVDEEHPEAEQEEEAEVVILKIEKDENDEDVYTSVDDEQIGQAVFDRFMAMLEEEDE
ncbi:MAG: DUF1292 domain-containing protein [Clostridiales bacterium]|nr:DUF1292 domain-containing protein [Clostridiales bacterium]